MIGRGDLRKEAYRYILEIIRQLPADGNINRLNNIPLEELRLIKEGVEDPSPSLVALIKDLSGGSINVAEIDLHLVKPFKR